MTSERWARHPEPDPWSIHRREDLRVRAADPEASLHDVVRKGHPGDAGIDLYVHPSRPGQEFYEIGGGAFRDLELGCSVALPPGYWGMLTGRSSTIRTRGLMVTQGVIDQGYRGPLFAGVWNLTQSSIRVNVGERIAQLILIPLWAGRAYLVDELEGSERGEQGFGSTGR